MLFADTLGLYVTASYALFDFKVFSEQTKMVTS